MIRTLFLLLFFKSILFGCTLCTIYSPETKVSININSDDERIKSAKITWVLTKEFTEQLKQIYDKNQNNYLDKRELEPIQQSLLDYIVKKDYLTHISYDKVINKEESLPIEVIKYKTYIKNSLLHFDYELKLDYDVIFDNALFINVNDDENYFILILAKNAVKFNAPYEVSTVQERQSVVFYLNGNKEEKTDKNIEEKSSKDDIKEKKKRLF